MSFLIDTDIFSAHMRRPGALSHRFIQHSGGVAVSSVTLAELYAKPVELLRYFVQMASSNIRAWEPDRDKPRRNPLGLHRAPQERPHGAGHPF